MATEHNTANRGTEAPPDGLAGFRTRVRKRFLAGMLVLTPAVITAWVLYQLFALMDGIFAPLLTRATGVRLPGLGLLLTLLVILSLGWLSTHVLGRRLIHAAERALHRIPVARSVYGGTKGVLEVLAQRQADAFKRAVLIEYPHPGTFAIAFVTGAARWPEIRPETADALMVFLPSTPNPTTGFLLLVPRERTVDLPFTVDEAVRMVISGGLLAPRPPAVASGSEPR